jgi:Protein of unknown function (DUF2909)
MTILIPVAFLLIIGCLAFALVFLMKDKGKTNRTVYALTMRIALSICLFGFILLAHKMGWIHPTGIRQ